MPTRKELLKQMGMKDIYLRLILRDSYIYKVTEIKPHNRHSLLTHAVQDSKYPVNERWSFTSGGFKEAIKVARRQNE